MGATKCFVLQPGEDSPKLFWGLLSGEAQIAVACHLATGGLRAQHASVCVTGLDSAYGSVKGLSATSCKPLLLCWAYGTE